MSPGYRVPIEMQLRTAINLYRRGPERERTVAHEIVAKDTEGTCRDYVPAAGDIDDGLPSGRTQRNPGRQSTDCGSECSHAEPVPNTYA